MEHDVLLEERRLGITPEIADRGASSRPSPPQAVPKNAARNYCFTHFGPWESLALLIDNGLPPDLKYFVGQFERCPTTGRCHFQGYVQFARKARHFHTLIGLIGPCHISVAKGTFEQNKEYCTKTHTTRKRTDESTGLEYEVEEVTRIQGPYELGEPTLSGQRSDIQALKQALLEERSDEWLAQNLFSIYLRNWKNIAHVRSKLIPLTPHRTYMLSQFTATPVDTSFPCLLVGETNLGKTSFALAHFEVPLDVTHMEDLLNLNQQHTGIVFSDLDFRHLQPSVVLNLLTIDSTTSVNVRYTTARLPRGMPRIFTSNRDDIFKCQDMTASQWRAIQRRYVTRYITEPLFAPSPGNDL